MKNMFSEGIYEEKPIAEGHTTHRELPKFDVLNPQVYFDICIGNPADKEEDKKRGRVVFELFSNVVPETAANFKAFCTGEKGWGRHYKDNIFHRIEPGKYIHGGDIDCQTGDGGTSIYGRRFNDEQIWLPHTHRGLVTHHNDGKADNNSCQFYITFKSMPEFDMHNTVVARVIHNYALIDQTKNIAPGEHNKPLTRITIEDSGELGGDDKIIKYDCDSLHIYREKYD